MKTFKNVKLFQAQGRQGFLVALDIEDFKDDRYAEEKLINWLKNNHDEIYWDIELHENGTVHLEEFEDGCQIVFTGDNNSFYLTEVEIERIVLNPMA